MPEWHLALCMNCAVVALRDHITMLCVTGVGSVIWQWQMAGGCDPRSSGSVTGQWAVRLGVGVGASLVFFGHRVIRL